MNSNTDSALIHEAISRSVERIYPSSETLEKELSLGRRLRIYYGIDPTSPHLHIGHLVPLLALRRFQKLGHEIIFLIGDFTARIGDPTDKLAARQPLTALQVKENFQTFKKQASRIIKFSGENRALTKFNSAWWGKMRYEDALKLIQHFTVQQLLERDMFQERIKNNKPINAAEFNYPIMQGYDSVVLDVDMEIGGTDQTFNMLVGRDLLKTLKQKEKFVLTSKLLADPETGKKFGKSEGQSLVYLDDEPSDMFGKIMALDDAMIAPLAEFCTTLSIEDVTKIKEMAVANPRDAKLKAAEAVVATVLNSSKARVAKRAFLNIFTEKKKPEDIPEISLGSQAMNLVDLLFETKLATSKSEARRLIEQGGVKINDERKSDPQEVINLGKEILIQVGPRRFMRVIR